jgi:hypothetical protein
MSERTFRRRRDRYQADGLEGIADGRLGKRLSQAGAGRPGARGADPLSRARPWPHRQALPRQLAPAPWFRARLHLDQAPAAALRPGPEGAAAFGASQEARASTLAQHAAASGRLAPPLAAGARPGSRPPWTTPHSEIYSAFLVEKEGTMSTFRALARWSRAHGCLRALHRPGQPRLRYAGPGRGSPRIS